MILSIENVAINLSIESLTQIGAMSVKLPSLNYRIKKATSYVEVR